MDETQQNNEQLYLFSDLTSLLSAASEQSSSAPTLFQESVRLYFIARYFVAIYESRYGEIPIQVWNEYRNALDHFFRLQTANQASEEADEHIKKMERHLQRAALDILKIFVHRTLETIESWKSSFPVAVYKLVDNGDFRPILIEREQAVRKAFELAKVSDTRLGDHSQGDADVLTLYLDAAFEADSVRLMLINRQNSFETAKENYDAIHTDGHKLSKSEHYKIHTLFYIAKYLVVFGLGVLYTTYSDDIKGFVKENLALTSQAAEGEHDGELLSIDKVTIESTSPEMDVETSEPE